MGSEVAAATESKACPELAEGDLRLQFVVLKGHGFKACPEPVEGRRSHPTVP
jgi:hypothetical protein